MPEITSYLTSVLTENFDVANEEITAHRTLDDLGVDSVSTIELVDILQEKFGVRIGDEELTNKNTVAQVISVLMAKLGE